MVSESVIGSKRQSDSDECSYEVRIDQEPRSASCRDVDACGELGALRAAKLRLSAGKHGLSPLVARNGEMEV